MKSELREPWIEDQFSIIELSERVEEKKIIPIQYPKSLKDITSEERKKEASKPLYLVRYE